MVELIALRDNISHIEFISNAGRTLNLGFLDDFTCELFNCYRDNNKGIICLEKFGNQAKQYIKVEFNPPLQIGENAKFSLRYGKYFRFLAMEDVSKAKQNKELPLDTEHNQIVVIPKYNIENLTTILKFPSKFSAEFKTIAKFKREVMPNETKRIQQGFSEETSEECRKLILNIPYAMIGVNYTIECKPYDAGVLLQKKLINKDDYDRLLSPNRYEELKKLLENQEK